MDVEYAQTPTTPTTPLTSNLCSSFGDEKTQQVRHDKRHEMLKRIRNKKTEAMMDIESLGPDGFDSITD